MLRQPMERGSKAKDMRGLQRGVLVGERGAQSSVGCTYGPWRTTDGGGTESLTGYTSYNVHIVSVVKAGWGSNTEQYVV